MLRSCRARRGLVAAIGVAAASGLALPVMRLLARFLTGVGRAIPCRSRSRANRAGTTCAASYPRPAGPPFESDGAAHRLTGPAAGATPAGRAPLAEASPASAPSAHKSAVGFPCGGPRTTGTPSDASAWCPCHPLRRSSQSSRVDRTAPRPRRDRRENRMPAQPSRALRPVVGRARPRHGACREPQRFVVPMQIERPPRCPGRGDRRQLGVAHLRRRALDPAGASRVTARSERHLRHRRKS